LKRTIVDRFKTKFRPCGLSATYFFGGLLRISAWVCGSTSTCNEAGLRHCSAHGLRKAGATIAADNGATTKQLMAIFGWSSSKMADHYTRAADQKRLAESAMHMIEAREQNGTESCPTEGPGGTFSTKN
jgi:integrase